MKGTMDSGANGPTTADCETVTVPQREQCMREAKGRAWLIQTRATRERKAHGRPAS
jgi:hypothetical protein